MDDEYSKYKYVEGRIVSANHKTWLMMDVTSFNLKSPCELCAFDVPSANCEVIQDTHQTGTESKWPCVNNVQHKYYLFIKPTDHEQFIASMVAQRMEK